MTNTNEKNTIEQELAIIEQCMTLRQQVTASRKARRSSVDDGDAGIVQEAQQAHDEALANVRATKSSLSIQKAELGELTTRQRGGDRSITSSNVREVKDEIETLENYIAADEKALKSAERVLRPLTADQHLAGLAAEILEAVTDVPVIIRRKVANAPDISPAIIVSQLEAMESYGTLDASGTVKLTLIGDPAIDWQAVNNVFDGLGCEGAVSANQISFDRAWWDVPRLREPAMQGIGALARSLEDGWHLQVSGAAEVQRLRDRGVSATPRSLWTGLVDRTSTDLTFEDGRAVGTATIAVAAQTDRGICMDFEALETELGELTRQLNREAVGDVTEAGEVVSVTLSDVQQRLGFGWDRKAVQWRDGGPVYPDVTIEATITVLFDYEQA